MGQFYTPDWLCQSIVNLCEINKEVKVMDPNCGTGRFFNWLPEEMNVKGIEIDIDACLVARMAFSNATICSQSFLKYQSHWRDDMSYIVGNPPFNILFK